MNSDPDYGLILENPDTRLRGLKWVTTVGHIIPNDAIPGGTDEDGQTLYIARALCNHALIPGKAGRHMSDGCSIVYNGAVEFVRKYQVLCGDPSKVLWVPLSMPSLFERNVRLVNGGFEGVQQLYICKSDEDPKRQLGHCRLNPSNIMLFSLKNEVWFTSNFKRLEYSN